MASWIDDILPGNKISLDHVISPHRYFPPDKLNSNVHSADPSNIFFFFFFFLLEPNEKLAARSITHRPNWNSYKFHRPVLPAMGVMEEVEEEKEEYNIYRRSWQRPLMGKLVLVLSSVPLSLSSPPLRVDIGVGWTGYEVPTVVSCL